MLTDKSFAVKFGKNQTDSLGFLVSDVARLMRRSFQRSLEGSSLTLAQARALVHVSRNEGIRQVELADLLEVQPMTLARLIDQLADAGLVERRADPVDRRAYHIHLTSAAVPELVAIDQVARTILKEAARDLTKDELAAVLDALRKMRDTLSGR
jgi:DNA-binding MarR family transcriptional regulator